MHCILSFFNNITSSEGDYAKQNKAPILRPTGNFLLYGRLKNRVRVVEQKRLMLFSFTNGRHCWLKTKHTS